MLQAKLRLPAWARVMSRADELEVSKGRDLKPGDIIIFSVNAYRRVLCKKLSDYAWSVTEQRPNNHKPGHITIHPDGEYVVKRAVQRQLAAAAPVAGDDPFRTRPLNAIRVEGRDLEVGDVIYLDPVRKRAKILEIDPITFIAGRGDIRNARLEYLDANKVDKYTFGNFKIQPPFSVIAGPKFDAARSNPDLVVWNTGVSRWYWKGG